MQIGKRMDRSPRRAAGLPKGDGECASYITIRAPDHVRQAVNDRAAARGVGPAQIAFEALVAGLDRPDPSLPNAKDLTP